MTFISSFLLSRGLFAATAMGKTLVPCSASLPAGVLEDGVTSNGVPRSTAPSGISNPEKKMSCGTQCPNPQSLSSGPLAQKQNGLRTAEVGHSCRTDWGPESVGRRLLSGRAMLRLHPWKRP